MTHTKTPPFHADEIVADDTHIYWSVAHDREYDDRPVRIARASVRRHAHSDTREETIFDFERDDRHCFPGALRLFRGAPAWHCRRPIFDGNARADSSRYMRWVDGRLSEVPAPWSQPPRIVAFESDVVILDRTQLVHVDADDGQTRTGATVRFQRPRIHDAAQAEILGSGRDEKGELLWTAPREGEGEARELYRPIHAEITEAIFIGSTVYASWDEDHRGGVLARIESGRATELVRGAVFGLLHAGEHLYFHTLDRIKRLHLETGRTEIIAEGRPRLGPRTIAVGGGWLYWLEQTGLRRVRL